MTSDWKECKIADICKMNKDTYAAFIRCMLYMCYKLPFQYVGQALPDNFIIKFILIFIFFYHKFLYLNFL